MSLPNKRAGLLIRQLIYEKPPNAYSAEEWEMVLRLARSSGMLSRLALFRSRFGSLTAPDFLTPHLDSAEKYWLSQKRIVDWELYNLQQVFQQLQIPLILLKGTSYLAVGLNAGLGRVFNDIDILVPKPRLQEVKEALKWRGWLPEQLDSYDMRYYERWMHELPPLRHLQRGTTLDVHHNILPETCQLCPDAGLLLKSAVNVSGTAYWVLAPEDMLLHSACHLFWGGEFENALRDLSDMDLLLREFSGKDAAFWQKLLFRAGELGLGRPLFYALRYTAKILETQVPEKIMLTATVYGGGAVRNRFMDFLFLRVLMPHHPGCDDGWAGFVRFLLFLRSHYLKMPLNLLLPHLSRKAWLRLAGREHK